MDTGDVTDVQKVARIRSYQSRRPGKVTRPAEGTLTYGEEGSVPPSDYQLQCATPRIAYAWQACQAPIVGRVVIAALSLTQVVKVDSVVYPALSRGLVGSPSLITRLLIQQLLGLLL